MNINVLTVTYKAKWRLKGHPNYYWTECKKLININSGREIKKTLHGLTPGYWISRKFVKIQDLLDFKLVELIPKEKLPF